MQRNVPLLVCLWLAACAAPAVRPTVTRPPTAAALTVTLTASGTATVSDTLTPTRTATPADRATRTPTVAPSATPSQTRTATPRSTLPPAATATPQPSATPALPPVPLYPNTPIQAWDEAAFRKSVADTALFLHQFFDFTGGVTRAGRGNCYWFWEHYGNWERQPAFTAVPPTWQPAYYELRSILDHLRVVLLPATTDCPEWGATYLEKPDLLNMMAGIEAATARLTALSAEVAAR